MRALVVAVLTAALLAGQESRAVRTFADGLVPARVLHVATTGDDAAGDGSASRPFATIAGAARAAKPGTALRVHEGSYPGGTFLSELRGTTAAPIWIGGAPGEGVPVISGRGEGLHLSKPRCVVLHDLAVRSTTGNGINVDDGGDMGDPEAARYLAFQNLEIRDVGGGGNEDGLKLSGVNDYAVLDSSFWRIGGASGSGIDQVGCHRGVVARCAFLDLKGNAIQAKGGSEDILIQSCKLASAGERGINLGGSTGAEYFRPPLRPGQPGFEARRLTVRDCTIAGSGAAVAFVGCVDCVVAGNTIKDPTRWVVRILQETRSAGGVEFLPASNGRFERNTVSYQRARLRTVVNVGPGTDPKSFTFADNRWIAEGEPNAPPPELPSPESRTSK
jgi:hypothetical protein